MNGPIAEKGWQKKAIGLGRRTREDHRKVGSNWKPWDSRQRYATLSANQNRPWASLSTEVPHCLQLVKARADGEVHYSQRCRHCLQTRTGSECLYAQIWHNVCLKQRSMSLSTEPPQIFYLPCNHPPPHPLPHHIRINAQPIRCANSKYQATHLKLNALLSNGDHCTSAEKQWDGLLCDYTCIAYNYYLSLLRKSIACAHNYWVKW